MSFDGLLHARVVACSCSSKKGMDGVKGTKDGLRQRTAQGDTCNADKATVGSHCTQTQGKKLDSRYMPVPRGVKDTAVQLARDPALFLASACAHRADRPSFLRLQLPAPPCSKLQHQHHASEGTTPPCFTHQHHQASRTSTDIAQASTPPCFMLQHNHASSIEPTLLQATKPP